MNKKKLCTEVQQKSKMSESIDRNEGRKRIDICAANFPRNNPTELLHAVVICTGLAMKTPLETGGEPSAQEVKH